MSTWRRQQAPARCPVGGPTGAGRRGERSIDGAAGVVNLAPRKLQEGEAGLRVVSVLVRPVEGLGSPLEVAHAEADLADHVLGVSDPDEEPVPLELVAGLAGLLLRLRPLAVEHLQLRPMDSTDARVAPGAVAAHPPLALAGPLRRAPQVADVAACRDRDAVDVARDPEIELARARRRGRFVDVREAVLPVPREDLAHALEAHRHVQRVDVVVPSGDLHRAVRGRDALLELAGHDSAESMERAKSRVHLALRLVGEQPLGPRQPTPTDRRVGALERLVGEGHRDPRGFRATTGIAIGGERPLEPLGCLVGMAGPPLCGAHQFEVVGRQVALAVGRREGLDRLGPGVAVESVSAALERLDHCLASPVAGVACRDGLRLWPRREGWRLGALVSEARLGWVDLERGVDLLDERAWPHLLRVGVKPHRQNVRLGGGGDDALAVVPETSMSPP